MRQRNESWFAPLRRASAAIVATVGLIACGGDRVQPEELLDVNVTPPELIGIEMGRILCRDVGTIELPSGASLSVLVDNTYGDSLTASDRNYMTYVVIPKLNGILDPHNVAAGSYRAPVDCRRT